MSAQKDEASMGSEAPIFSEPPITLADLPPLTDPELFEDEQTPERLRTIIRHMHNTAGRNERSMLIEYLPLPDGGKRFVMTFPHGDEREMCKMWAEEVRREGVEDPAVADRLNAAHEQVKRAKAVVGATEYTAFRVGALAGDIIDMLTKLRDADAHEVWDMIEDMNKQLAAPELRPFLRFVDVCRASRAKTEAETQIERIREEQEVERVGKKRGKKGGGS